MKSSAPLQQSIQDRRSGVRRHPQAGAAGDFDKQLHKRLELAKREKQGAIALAEAKLANELQSAAARKDVQIQALQAQIAACEVARKLTVTEALGAVSKERDGLANELEQKTASVLIAARAHSTGVTGLFGQ